MSWSNKISFAVCMSVAVFSVKADPFFLESIGIHAGRSSLNAPELNGATRFYEYSPPIITSRILDFSDDYSEDQYGFSVDVGIGKNYAGQISYFLTEGGFNTYIESQTASNEALVIHLLSSGNDGGILADLGVAPVNSTFNYEVEGVEANFSLKRLIGNSYVGLNYSHARFDYDSKLNQILVTGSFLYSHRLDETIESTIHRVGLLIGHEFAINKAWSVSVEADLGMAVANDEYSGRQSVDGVQNPENDNYETSNKRNYFSPKVVLASHHYFGSFKISPFIMASMREVTQVEYSGPGVGEQALNVTINQPLTLSDVQQTSLGAGLNLTLLF